MKISFIVIGRNEQNNLNNCFDSISNFIKKNNLNEYEIIFVDSNSIDNSIQIALDYLNIKVIKIWGEINAAVARNIGAKNSLYDTLFFIDADMVIKSDFYKFMTNNNNDLIYDFVSGDLQYNYYDYSNVFINSELYYNLTMDRIFYTVGGIFVIHKYIWDKFNGMDYRFRRSQDFDFAIRLSHKNIFLLRKKEIIAEHNTISYYDTKRLWSDLLSGNPLYQKSLLYRKHIFKPIIFRFLKKEILLFSFPISIILSYHSIYFLITPLFLAYTKVLFKKKFTNFFMQGLYYFLLDFICFWGLFFFHPKKRNNYQFKFINFD